MVAVAMPPYSDVTDFSPVREIERRPSPFDGVLEQGRDFICDALDEALAGMLDQAADAIGTYIKETVDREEFRLYEEARQVLREQRPTLEAEFQAHYLEEFQRRCNQARHLGPSFSQAGEAVDSLELIGEEDFDETLKFDAMAAKLRAYCDEELSALDQRVAVLLGDANLLAKDNPFAPQVICDAYKHACRQLGANLKVRRVLLKLFDDHVLDAIRSVYKDVNTLLVRNSILPKIRYNLGRKSEQAEAGAGAEAGAAGTPMAAMAAAAAQDLFAVLQGLVASRVPALGQVGVAAAAPATSAAVPQPGMLATAVAQPVMLAGAGAQAGMPVASAAPSGTLVGSPAVVQPGVLAEGAAQPAVLAAAAAEPGTPVVSLTQAGAPAGVVLLQGTELMGTLTRIQRGDLSAVEGGNLAAASGARGTINVLHELKTSNVAAGMGQVDLLTLDIIAMLFDQLFDDPKVPNGVKGLIGRLQIPMLKVAIADKTFFSTKAHPARRLLDALGEIALRLPADFSTENPLFERVQNLLQEVVDGFQEDLEIFTTTRDKLLALLSEEDQRIEEQTQAAAKQVEQQEHLALAKSIAQEEVKARLQAHKLPRPIREFLGQQWLKLLLLIHVKAGKESDAWKHALDTMDQLVWSVEPKHTLEERRKLATTVPRLVKRITAGLRSAGVDDAVRVGFFAELLKYQTQAINAPATGRPEDAAPQDAQAPADGAQPLKPPAPSLELAPAYADPQSLDFSAPITVKNPFGEGEVSVDSQDLDFTDAAQGARAKREASIARALDNLQMGTWVEFREPGEKEVRRAARLIFVSPRKTRYLFAADRAGKDIIQCTRAEIGRRFRIGEAVKLDGPPEESLFDRIMNGLLGKLRASGGRVPFFAQSTP